MRRPTDVPSADELILDNVCQHVFHIKPGGTHLLGDEAGSCHARCGVDLEQVDFASFGDDVVHADDTFTTQDVIDGGCECLYTSGGLTVSSFMWEEPTA